MDKMDKIIGSLPILKNNSSKPKNDWQINYRYNLGDDEIDRNRHAIWLIEQKQETCKSCKGDLLKHEKCDGYVSMVDDTGGKFSEVVRKCKYRVARDEQTKIEKTVFSAKIPIKYRGIGWDRYKLTPDNEKPVFYAKNAVSDKTAGLYIYGNCGTGKTMMAAIIANEKVKDGQTVLFSACSELLESIRRSYDTGDTDNVLSTIRTVPCLILDDIGAEKVTEWVSEQLFNIINYRNNAELQTIITSNYSPVDISRRLATEDNQVQGQRIVSRILEMCIPIKLVGDDYRLGVRL